MLYNNDSHSSEAIIVFFPGEQYVNHTSCLTFSERANEAGVRHNQELEGGNYVIKHVFQNAIQIVCSGLFRWVLFLVWGGSRGLDRGALVVKTLPE